MPEYTTPILLNGADITNNYETKESFYVRANDSFENVQIFMKSGEEGEFALIGNDPISDDGIYYFYANYIENGESKTSNTYRVVKDGQPPEVIISGDYIYSNSATSKVALRNIIVDATDSISSSWELYYRAPNTSTFVAAEGHHFAVNRSEENYGTWQFYGRDNLGNQSSTISVSFLGDSWISDDSYIETPAGSGTETAPYIVSSASQLAWFADKTFNKSELSSYTYIELANDLDLSAHGWIPIGYNQLFVGSFDGKGHVIRGLNVATSSYRALFGRLGKTPSNKYSTFSNVGFEDGISTSSSLISSISASGAGSFDYFNVKIINCYNKSNVSVSGLIGSFIRGNSKGALIIENCYNIGDISGTGYCGGLLGSCSTNSGVSDEFLIMKNSYNTGNITSSSNYVGGVVGSVSKINIINCYNTGRVKGASNVGGLIGGSSIMYSNITNCYNIGDVEGKSNCVGGLMGQMSYNNTITNCFAECNISHTGTSTAYVGGLVSVNTNFQNLTFQNCHYKGKISIATTSNSYVSGFVASSVVPKAGLVFENCWAQAEIEAPNVSKANATNIKPFMTYNTGIKNCVYDVKITTKDGVLTEEDGVISKGYYDDGDDSVATDFVGEDWFYCDKLCSGMPILRSEYWVACGIPKQIDVLVYLQNNGWTKITA